MSKLHKNLKLLRKKFSISQEKLADIIGIKRHAYAAYEEYRAEPNIKTLIAISNYYDISIDSLLKTDL